tara:strand:- start:5620 stop:6267 length:648 start_codon:yes stop_codon:yes gene_type:complete
MNDDKNELTLEKLFTTPIQNPFSYSLNFGDPPKGDCYEYLFEQFKKIFVNGIIYTTDHVPIKTNDGQTIHIDKVKKEQIELVKKYMLSVGIEVIYKEFTLEDKDYYIRGLLYDIQDIENLNIDVVIDWKTQLIKSACINVKQENFEESMRKIKKHPYANYFLNLYKPENNLKDFVIKYVTKENPKIMHIIYFEPAKTTDYHYYQKHFDQFDKHVR